jgi:HEAT repeat protein
MLMNLAVMTVLSAASPHDALVSLLSRIEQMPSAKELQKLTPTPESLLVEVASDAGEHVYVRERAVSLMGEYPSAASDLIKLTRDRVPSVRQSAAYVLGRHFGATQPDLVLGALRPLLKDARVSVRKQVVRALSHVHSKAVVAVLQQRLAHEADPGVREFIYSRALQLEASQKSVAAR